MQTSVTLSKEAQELLKESLEPTTTAAEVEAPAAPVINELQQVEQPAHSNLA